MLDSFTNEPRANNAKQKLTAKSLLEKPYLIVTVVMSVLARSSAHRRCIEFAHDTLKQAIKQKQLLVYMCLVIHVEMIAHARTCAREISATSIFVVSSASLILSFNLLFARISCFLIHTKHVRSVQMRSCSHV